jgi:hypothetical protein
MATSESTTQEYHRKRQLSRIAAAADQRTYLLKIRDVFGYGTGFRERGGKRTEEPALIVYVRRGRKKRDKHDYPRHQQIPERVRWKVGGETLWLPVDLIEIDKGKLQSMAPPMGGDSVGNQSASHNSGSIGWIARRAGDGAPVLCGNYHVFLKFPPRPSNDVLKYPQPGQPLDNVTSPSREDGGNVNTDVVGVVVRGRRDDLVDVAIATLVPTGRPVSPIVHGLGQIGRARSITTQDLHARLEVHLFGRTSGLQNGNVVEYPGRVGFEYPDLDSPLVMFDLIVTDIETRDGDSGSLLLDNQNRPLGMLIGTGGNRSFFMHIANIRSAMKLKDF